MSEKIEVEIEYTPEDYARSLKYITNRQFLVKYSLLFIYAIFGCIFLFSYLTDPAAFKIIFSSPLTLVTLLIPILVFTGWWFYAKDKPGYLLKRNIKNQFKSSPALREPKIISFDEEGIYGTSQFGGGLTKWTAFIEAAETADDFLFFTSNKVAQFVPKRFFTSEQINQIRTLAAGNMEGKINLLQ
ncbi:MAG TPA: YcxB family protein [Pyrinomonadaceae bacterium]|jgi:hypothetical protein